MMHYATVMLTLTSIEGVKAYIDLRVQHNKSE
jgi:hypothetical protein